MQAPLALAAATFEAFVTQLTPNGRETPELTGLSRSG
jgi:hypothetical protein